MRGILVPLHIYIEDISYVSLATIQMYIIVNYGDIVILIARANIYYSIYTG